MENNIDEIQEVELKEQAENENGPEHEDVFGIPADDVELEEFEEEVEE